MDAKIKEQSSHKSCHLAMSVPALNSLNVEYTYPSPLPSVTTKTIEAILQAFKERFTGEEGEKRDTFAKLRKDLIEKLNKIFGASTFSPNEKGHITLARLDEVCTDCDEANIAYKFYAKKIVQQINRLTDIIAEAQQVINAIDACGLKPYTEAQLNDLVHSLFVKLEILNEECLKIQKAFGTYYEYDPEEDLFKVTESYDTKLDDEEGKPIADRPTLRSSIIIYNELNLIDRLKYIKLYYDAGGGTTASVFPDNKTYGFPCTEDKTQDGISKAALEKFYLGYLIDRDGPINAISSFLEIKVSSLQATISLMQKKIEALNVYLEFINRGLELLNQSQSKSSKDDKPRIPDGTIIAVTYLCGQLMYNLYEYDGKNYLVIPRQDGDFFLIPANQEGMKMLLGDNANQSPPVGNSAFAILTGDNLKIAKWGGTAEIPKGRYENTNNGALESYEHLGTEAYQYDLPSNFTVPTQLDVATIIPGSVKYYGKKEIWDGPGKETAEWKSWTDAINSWTTAFSTKTQYINTAIEEINTDIQALRTRIDTLNSLANNWRGRYQETATNYLNHIQ